MITIDQYIFPASVSEADALLHERADAAIIGGGVFTRLISRKIGLGIDLSRAGLDYVRESDQSFEIGAMTTLRTLETHESLNRLCDGVLSKAAGQIAGVQLRNLATIGGTFYGRYAFSDLITALLALDGTVVLHRGGEMAFADFLAAQRPEKDILACVRLAKADGKAAYQHLRITAGSLPVLTVAVVKRTSGFRIAVGARPGQAVLATAAMASLLNQQPSQTASADELAVIADQAAMIAADEVHFADDRRASGVYRKLLCRTLVKRALLEVMA